MKKLNLYAIIAGAAADMFGTIIVTIAVGSAAWATLLAQGVPEDEIGVRLSQDVRVLTWSVVLGLFASVAGGLVAGRIARFRELMHGASAGAVGLVLSTVSAVIQPANLPTWYIITGHGLVIPAAALGAWFAKIWNDRSPPPQPKS